MVEHMAVNHQVIGSIPIRGVKTQKRSNGI